MIYSHIAAMSQNRVIGRDNDLPWDIPEDLQFFKDKTSGHILIMGRKTFESMKGPLPKRFHIVITRNPDYQIDHPRVRVVTDLTSAYRVAEELAQAQPEYGQEVFIAGGGEIYKQSLDKADRLYLTLIERTIEGDAHYPEFSETDFQLTEETPREGFRFQTFERIKS